MTPNRFLQICGGTQPFRVTVTGADGESATLAFPAPFIRIGSDPRADIVIAGVASLDTVLFLVEGTLFCLPMTDDADADWIDAGTTIEIGDASIRALNPLQSSHAPEFHPFDRDATLPALHFEAQGRLRSSKPLAIHPRLLLIGRDEPAKFKINHPSIRTVHAAILRTPAGPWIIDLTLHDETLLNDAAISAAPLRDGDRVTLGEVELTAHTPVASRTAAMTPTAAPMESAVGPILQQVAQFQQQTFEQFREMLGSMTNMFGAVLNEHRQFVREEFARLERIGATPTAASIPVPQIAPSVPPPPAPVQYKTPTPPESVEHILPSGPGASAAPANAGMHAWVQEQIGSLEKQQTTRWQKILEKFRGY